MRNWAKMVAAVIACVAVIILAYAVLTPEPRTEDTNRMGMWHATYSSAKVSLIAVSLAMLVAALMVLLLWQSYEPLPPQMAPPSTAREHLVPPTEPGTSPAPASPSSESKRVPDDRVAEAAHNYLVLRLLTGDERTMFKAIMDSGGKALQKELIVRTRMSNAKVSRVLDRLAEKGVITKERHGSTNLIQIKPLP